MKPERSGCLKLLGPLADLLAIKDEPQERLDSRMVKTKSGIEVELMEDQPDEMAEGMARAFLTGKVVVGHRDEATGKWIDEEIG